jgi:hypothetical protein
MQVNGRLRKPLPPQHTVWIGGEVDRPMTLTTLQSYLCTFVLKFIKSFGRGLHYSFGTAIPSPVAGPPGRPSDDLPKIVVPCLKGLDRAFAADPERGDKPWVLGDMLPDEAQYKELKACSSVSEDFRVGPTYTFAMWDMYLDFDRWQATNLPGVKFLELKSYWGEQALRFVIYAAPTGAPIHLTSQRVVLLSFEVVHDSHASFAAIPLLSPTDPALLGDAP